MTNAVYYKSMMRQDLAFAQKEQRYERRMQEALHRAHTVRNQYMMLFALSAILVLTIGFLVTGIKPHAASGEEMGEVCYKYYTNVVLTGDYTMDDIVDQYADKLHYNTPASYVKEVASINHLTAVGTTIRGVSAGDHLIVPYFSKDYK